MKTFFLLIFPFALLFVFNITISKNFSGCSVLSLYEKGLPNKVIDTLDKNQTPVIPGDFADPSIIRKDSLYYATGTSSEWAPHFPLFQSHDLMHWLQVGYIFQKTPEWASSSFWAPELFYWQQTFYVYYVARRKSDGISCIGVATSQNPKKGFTDQGILLEFGKEAIDPFVIEDNGELYLTFKAYGLDKRPIEILGCRLSANGLKTAGEPFMLLRDDERIGLEGQCLIKKNNYYYLFYSQGNCCGRGCNYKVNIARSKLRQGPYEKFKENPIVTETEDWKCPGHGTIVETMEGNDFYLYHAYNKKDDVYTGRQGLLAQVFWNDVTGWPSIQPTNGMSKSYFRDDFINQVALDQWQWDFRNAKPDRKMRQGILYLSGKTKESNQTGTALTIRPFTGNFEITSSVLNSNASLKGLVIYGDANQSAGVGIKDSSILVWEVKNDIKSILIEVPVKIQMPVHLKISVEDGYKFKFFWSDSTASWKEIKTGGNYYNGRFLPLWDRSPRPGLFHYGSPSEPAAFDFFEIKYK